MHKYTTLHKVVITVLACLFLSNDISLAIPSIVESSRSALAPPLATKPPCEIYYDEKTGTCSVISNNDVLESWDKENVRSVKQGETLSKAFRNRWVFVDVSYLIGQMLMLTNKYDLRNPKYILIPIIKKHIRNRNGEAEILLEGYDIDGIEEVSNGQTITGFSLPVTRNGRVAYRLIYDLQNGEIVIPIRDGASVYVGAKIVTPNDGVIQRLPLCTGEMGNELQIYEPIRGRTIKIHSDGNVIRGDYYTDILVSQMPRIIAAFQERGKAVHRSLDMGTGRGSLAICQGAVFPDTHIVAVDINEKALEIATQNAIQNGMGHRFETRLGDTIEPLKEEERFDSVMFTLPTTIVDVAGSDMETYKLQMLDGGRDGRRNIDLVSRNINPSLSMGAGMYFTISDFIGVDKTLKLLEDNGFTARVFYSAKKYLDETVYTRSMEPYISKNTGYTFTADETGRKYFEVVVIEAIKVKEVPSPHFKECRSCINTTRNPAITIDKDGYCNICAAYSEAFDPKALAEEREFIRSFIGSGEGKYDVMVGLSGGKDSSATLKDIKDRGFTPLAFTIDPGYLHPYICERAKKVAEICEVDYEIIPGKQYLTPKILERFQRMARLYERNNKKEFIEDYANGRQEYRGVVRPCWVCRELMIRAYYSEALKHGVRVIVLGVNEWTFLNQTTSGKKFAVSAIRKLQPFKDKPAVYIVHAPFLFQRDLSDTRKILEDLGWDFYKDVQSNAHSCLLASAAEKQLYDNLGFPPDETRFGREVTVGFLTKDVARKALTNITECEYTIPKILRKAGLFSNTDNLFTPDSERSHKDRLSDTIKFIQAQGQNQPLIVALGTSWIKGYEKGRYLQYNALNPLISNMSNHAQFIVGDDKDLLTDIKKKMGEKGFENASVIVLAGEATVTKEMTELDNGKNILFGVDNKYLTEDSYMRIMEMLEIAAKFALDPASIPNSPNIPIEKRGNRWIFIPKAEPKDYELLKVIYESQRFA